MDLTPAIDLSMPAPCPNGCGAGEVCLGNACTSGCLIGGSYFTPNEYVSTCQTCQPAISTSLPTNVADGTACAQGSVCSNGACTVGC